MPVCDASRESSAMPDGKIFSQLVAGNAILRRISVTVRFAVDW
jgi:hypothetical protein